MADIKKKKKQAKEKHGAKVKKEAGQGIAYHLVPYILVVSALWLVLCFVTTLFCNSGDSLGQAGKQGDHILGVAGYYTSAVFMGFMGPAAFAIPALLVIFVIFWKKYNKRSFVALNSVLAFVASALIAALIHVFWYLGGTFSASFKVLYGNGVALRGGGVIGGYIGFGLYKLTKVGSIFVLIAILIPVMLFLFGTTPVEVARKIGAWIGKKREKSREKAAVRKLEKEAAEKERKEREKEEKALAAEQARLDREQALEQERLDREAAREQARLEKEAERAARLAEKSRPPETEEDPQFKAPEELQKDNCVIKVATPDPAEEPIDEETPLEEADVEENAREDDKIVPDQDDDKLTLYAFNEEEKQHIDGIKEPKAEIDQEDVDEDDLPDTEVHNFVDPNGKESRIGLDAVDDMAAEFFEENYQVDTETGEVFTPAVQNKEPKSAKEFREQNETHEERFVGEIPPPPPIPEYKFPPVDLLEAGSGKYTSDPAEVEENAKKLRGVLADFRIPVREISCSCGPTITRYEVKPEAGVRVKQIANLVDDIAMGLEKTGVRIEAPIPGKAAVGIEVPNDKPASVKLRNLIENPDFVNHKSKIAACLGADVSGNPVVFDIEKMPHLLVAGTTGSGKSVCINSIIMSILYHAKPNEVKLVLIDPKQVEFQVYRNIPHLACRIISNPKKAAGALNSAVNEMEKRFELIKEVGVRNISGYNEITKNDPEKPYMPRMVIIIDEFADLMMTARDEVETAVVRIAQKARAAGIHLIIGTQRPSADVITGLIKSNVPSRIAFTVKQMMDSRVILDIGGAEKLCGRGDMLYSPIGSPKPLRVQGSLVSDEEVEKVVDFVRDNNAPVVYDNEFESLIESEAAKCGGESEEADRSGGDFKGGDDEEASVLEAAEIAINAGKLSTSLLQRRLKIGYGKAARIIDTLEEMGVIGPADGPRPRKVLMTMEEFRARVEEGGSEE